MKKQDHLCELNWKKKSPPKHVGKENLEVLMHIDIRARELGI